MTRPPETDRNEAATLWQTQPVEAPAGPPSHRDRSGVLDRQVRRRNRLEYISFAVVSLFFLAVAAGLVGGPPAENLQGAGFRGAGDLLVRLGALALVIGSGVAAFQLHRRGTPPRNDPTRDCAQYYRDLLTGQIQALSTVRRWYIGPMVPGLGLMALGWLVMPGMNAIVTLVVVAVIVAVLVGVDALNRRAAADLMRERDGLENGPETRA